jgi:septal ring factor EnvC (AmiA/AmiB activator)
MHSKRFNRDDAERMMPLLRSIGRELRERTRAVTALEEHLAALSVNSSVHAQEMSTAESNLSTQRRELRRCENELAQLGCNVDADHPLRILIPSIDGALAYESKLDGTQFYRKPLDARR